MFISFTYQRLSDHFFTSRNTPNRQSADTEQFEFTLRAEVGSNRVLLCYCTQVEFLDICTLLEFLFFRIETMKRLHISHTKPLLKPLVTNEKTSINGEHRH